jgi:nucleotide-binding universal stress UspA family protein
MMKILVPTDFSSASMKAVEGAVRLARLCEAEVVIHHAYFIKLEWGKLAVQPDEDEMKSMTNKEQARAVLDGLKSRYSDVSVRTQLSDYETIEELLNYAKNEGVDLIITGTRGQQEIANRIMGSDAQRVVRLAHCPVIVLPDSDLEFPFKRILFVSDLTEDFSAHLARLLKLARCMGAEVHLGFVNTPMGFQCSEETEKHFKDLRKDFPDVALPGHIYNHVRVDHGIQLMAQRAGADVIALVTHSRKGFRRLFYSSLTEKIVLNSDFPIVSFHHKG